MNLTNVKQLLTAARRKQATNLLFDTFQLRLSYWKLDVRLQQRFGDFSEAEKSRAVRFGETFAVKSRDFHLQQMTELIYGDRSCNQDKRLMASWRRQ